VNFLSIGAVKAVLHLGELLIFFPFFHFYLKWKISVFEMFTKVCEGVLISP